MWLYLLSLLCCTTRTSRFLISNVALPFGRLWIAADPLALVSQPLDGVEKEFLVGKLVGTYGLEEEVLTLVVFDLVDKLLAVDLVVAQSFFEIVRQTDTVVSQST